MENEAQLKRGQKWAKVKAEAERKNDVETLKWMDSQDSIVKDIEAFNKALEEKNSKSEDKPKAEGKKAAKRD